MTTRKELVEALRVRYRSAAFSDRIKILDEFVALTCYHRKHAIRVLRGEISPATCTSRGLRPDEPRRACPAVSNPLQQVRAVSPAPTFFSDFAKHIQPSQFSSS